MKVHCLLPFLPPLLCAWQMIVDRLFWPRVPELLESVGDQEGDVCVLRERIQSYIGEALVPLAAYARQYTKYVELANTSAVDFME